MFLLPTCGSGKSGELDVPDSKHLKAIEAETVVKRKKLLAEVMSDYEVLKVMARKF
jgi:hypothetical protein